MNCCFNELILSDDDEIVDKLRPCKCTLFKKDSFLTTHPLNIGIMFYTEKSIKVEAKIKRMQKIINERWMCIDNLLDQLAEVGKLEQQVKEMDKFVELMMIASIVE